MGVKRFLTFVLYVGLPGRGRNIRKHIYNGFRRILAGDIMQNNNIGPIAQNNNETSTQHVALFVPKRTGNHT